MVSYGASTLLLTAPEAAATGFLSNIVQVPRATEARKKLRRCKSVGIDGFQEAQSLKSLLGVLSILTYGVFARKCLRIFVVCESR
jgi:hypothetical protein